MEKKLSYLDGRLILNKELDKAIEQKANEIKKDLMKLYKIGLKADWDKDIVFLFLDNIKNKIQVRLLLVDLSKLNELGKLKIILHFKKEMEKEEILDYCLFQDRVDENMFFGNYIYIPEFQYEDSFLHFNDSSFYIMNITFLKELKDGDVIYNFVYENNDSNIFLIIEKKKDNNLEVQKFIYKSFFLEKISEKKIYQNVKPFKSRPKYNLLSCFTNVFNFFGLNYEENKKEELIKKNN